MLHTVDAYSCLEYLQCSDSEMMIREELDHTDTYILRDKFYITGHGFQKSLVCIWACRKVVRLLWMHLKHLQIEIK